MTQQSHDTKGMRAALLPNPTKRCFSSKRRNTYRAHLLYLGAISSKKEDVLRHKHPIPVHVFALLLAAASGWQAQAGTINGITLFSLPGFSTGSASPSLPSSVNNDNAPTASPNSFNFSIFFNSGGLGPAEIEFGVTNSQGTTEYRGASAGLGLINNTGSPFSGFMAELGFGTGANFVRSAGAGGLDFDTPDRDPVPQASSFPVLTHNTDSLVWSGGNVPSVGGFSLNLSIDVPDGLDAFHPDGLNRFTVRLTPIAAETVPEPATILLFGSVLPLMCLVRCFRRRA